MNSWEAVQDRARSGLSIWTCLDMSLMNFQWEVLPEQEGSRPGVKRADAIDKEN